jgi:hypothetical protein
VLKDGSILVLGGLCSVIINNQVIEILHNNVWKSSDGGVNWAQLTSAAWKLDANESKYFFIFIVKNVLISTLF